MDRGRSVNAGIQMESDNSHSMSLLTEFCRSMVMFLSSISEEEVEIAERFWCPAEYPRFDGNPENFRAFKEEWMACDRRMQPPTTAEEAKDALLTRCLPVQAAHHLSREASLGDIWIQLERLYGPNRTVSLYQEALKKKRVRKKKKDFSSSGNTGSVNSHSNWITEKTAKDQPLVMKQTGARAGQPHCKKAKIGRAHV